MIKAPSAGQFLYALALGWTGTMTYVLARLF